ncbi:ferrous iron transport protein B, partial [Clostridium tarantellae]
MTTIALLGNPNVGKTTLFNALTGSNQHVGNWPGVTVDKKEGFFKDIKIVDLPGIYAMDTFSNEEKVSKNFLETTNVDLILNIVDASNLDRNLYLTMQLKQFNKPMVLLINMLDIADKKGIKIDYTKLEKNFNIKVIPIMASKSHGIDALSDFIEKKDFSNYLDNNNYNFESESKTYAYIENNLKNCFMKTDSTEFSLTEKLDRVFLNPWLAYPLFMAIMYCIFQFTFSWVGTPISDFLSNLLDNTIIPYLSNLLSNVAPWFQSLLIDGIVSGVGGILVLLPVVLTLFLCISILEDSGYMARVAFLMDKFMRKIGLSGKAFIPMVIGFGCTVPAIMSARTLESEKDRKLTALLVPFMSCNARLPVYVVFTSIFFPKNAGLIVTSLYFLGIVVAFIIGLLFKNTLFKKDEEPFVIELPEYKIPEAKSILTQLSEKAKGFLRKAGTIIFAMSVVIWFLQSFNFTGMVEDVSQSFLYMIGNFIAPIFTPLGFGDWQASVSLLTGLMAKETVVSTMEVIYKGQLETMLPLYFTTLSSYAFMVFVLLYTPCVSVIGVMKKEFGTRFTLFSISYQIMVAWIVSY